MTRSTKTTGLGIPIPLPGCHFHALIRLDGPYDCTPPALDLAAAELAGTFG